MYRVFSPIRIFRRDCGMNWVDVTIKRILGLREGKEKKKIRQKRTRLDYEGGTLTKVTGRTESL